MVAEPAARATARECRTFCRYLIGRAPSEYLVGWYQRGIESASGWPTGAPPIDRALLAAARLGGPVLRAADGYARLFRSTGSLRRRLTLLAAILENAPDTHLVIHRGTEGSRGRIVVGLLGSLAASGILTAIGLAGFGLVHLVTGPFGPRQSSR
jgi:hypothetical protein